MTTYYLHGGYVSVLSEENFQFFRGILSGIQKEDIHILLVLFAREEPKWKDKSEETKERFSQVQGGKNLSFEIASKDTKVFIDQIKESDIIFIHGGETKKLQEKLEGVENLKSLIEGRIIAGSSAGALVFAKHYYENDTDSYHTGLGFLNTKLICHWKDQYIQMEYLRQIGNPNCSIVTIAEGDFIIQQQ